MFEGKAILESLKNKNTQQTSSMIMSYSNNVVYFDLLPCPSWCLTCNKHWICNHRMKGWISCNRMWEVIKHVLMIPLGLPKGLLRSWKRNRKWCKHERTGKYNWMSSENQWRQNWSIFTSVIFRDRPLLLHWFSVLIELCFPVLWLCSILYLFSFTFVFYFKLWLFRGRLWWQSFSPVRPVFAYLIFLL